MDENLVAAFMYKATHHILNLHDKHDVVIQSLENHKTIIEALCERIGQLEQEKEQLKKHIEQISLLN